MRRYLTSALVAAVLLAGCGDGATAPSAAAGSETLLWNARARTLVQSFGDSPPFAGRLYALLSIAQHNAIVDAGSAPGRRGAAERARLERLALATASAAVLTAARPGQARAFRDTLVAERAASDAPVEDVLAAEEIGQRAARAVLGRASHDASSDPWDGTLPGEEGAWREDHGDDPLLANWGRVRPWFMARGDELRAPPPPARDSEAFMTALGEVRTIARTRTKAQMGTAAHWADERGSATPPGHWNLIAARLLERHPRGERETARLLSVANMAMMDATIACWDSKYTYWVQRPWQADSTITTLVGRPPHPSYPSGHSCISYAAAGVLAAAFPEEAATLERRSAEASLSRLYAGLHYRFDLEAGAAIGRAVAQLALRPDVRIPTTDELLAQFPTLRRASVVSR